MSPNSLYLIVSAVFALVIGYHIYNWLKDRTITTPEVKLARFKSQINWTVFILGVTLVLASVLFHINILQYRSPIPYENINTITLRDFTGYRLPTQTLDGMKDFAFITTSRQWEKDGKELEIKSFFHPSRSYVFNDNIVDKFLLKHELYHFHITEVFSRKCREELARFQQAPSKAQILDIIKDNKLLENAMQYDYDEETYHGYILKQQKQWEIKIDSLLTSLQKFRNTKIQY